jgi:MoaA/NifB/PqqE/SkfB family radical SAM enzyme
MAMKKIIEIKSIKEETYMINWLINNICTYACTYCIPDLYAGKNNHYDLDLAKKFIDVVADNIGHNKVMVSFSGGEPTIFPKFDKLCKYLRDKGWTLGITTNGSRKPEYFTELSPLFSYMCFSYHPSYHNENFFEAAQAASANTLVMIRVMFDPLHWDLALETYNRCAQNPDFATEAVRLYKHEGESLGSTGADVGYTPEQDEFLKNVTRVQRKSDMWNDNHDSESIAIYDDGSKAQFDAIDIVNRRQNSFLGWECDIGKSQIFINYDGLVKKGNCFQDGWVTSVQDFDPKVIFEARTICRTPFCYCVTDIKTPKRKIMKVLPPTPEEPT